MRLTGIENRWAEAAMGAIFPGSREEGLTDIRAMDVRGFLARVVTSVPSKVALGLRLAVWIVALAPLFVLGRLATITSLAQADRERVVAALVMSRNYALRSLVMILKTMGALLYAGDDAVRARMMVPNKPKSLVTLRVKGAPAVA
jgi:hypothetical protein